MKIASTGKVLALCISEKTGTVKHLVGQCRFIAGRGIQYSARGKGGARRFR